MSKSYTIIRHHGRSRNRDMKYLWLICQWMLLVGDLISKFLKHLSSASDRQYLVKNEVSNRGADDQYQVRSKPWRYRHLINEMVNEYKFSLCLFTFLPHQSSFSLSIPRQVRRTCMMCSAIEDNKETWSLQGPC